MNIALFNLENYSTQPALMDIIRKHAQDIKLVVLSDPYGGKRGGVLKQTWKNLRDSGFQFVSYLFFKILFPQMWSIVSRILKRIGLDTGYQSISDLCREQGIPVYVTSNINSKQTLLELKKHEIDLITIYYFDQILKNNIIQFPERGVVNFHPASLPSCRGLFPIFFSKLYNQNQFGISAHIIEDEKIDSGPILAKKEVTLDNFDGDLLHLDRAISNLCPELFSEVIHALDHLKQEAQIQQEGSYFSYPTRMEVKKLAMPLVQLKSYFQGL